MINYIILNFHKSYKLERIVALYIFFMAVELACPGDVFPALSKKKILRKTEIKNIYRGAVQKNTARSVSGKRASLKIKLGSYHFDPLVSVPERGTTRSGALSRTKSPHLHDFSYFIVQYDAPVKPSWKKSLQALGAEIFDYVPDFAFIIRTGSDQKQDLASLPHVRWVGDYQPLFKLSHRLNHSVYSKRSKEEKDRRCSFQVNVFPGEDISFLKNRVFDFDGEILSELATRWKTTLKVRLPSGRINDLASLDAVKYVEPAPTWKLNNNVATDIMAVRSPRNDYGLYGSGQVVGICDTGLDQGTENPANLHDDFEDGSGLSRVVQIIDLAGDGNPADENSGHGTHVAGSVLGNGLLSGSQPDSDNFAATSFAGIAPKAELIFQACENNSDGSLLLPSDLNVLFAESQTAGADLHTNSWGASSPSAYTSSSAEVDQYMWDHKDFLILFSAGNAGMDQDADGVIDAYGIDSPATAKNCLTVGATENLRTAEGYQGTWGTAWPLDFSADPIFSDLISDNPFGMAAFSSRGPTLDGRYKPDIVAPGTNIISTRSSLAGGEGWGIYDEDYMYMGGTSMATPLTAGAAVLLREYLMSVEGLVFPSAALLKAALLNSAEDVSPGQYGTGFSQEIPDPPVPNSVEGWGRVNLLNSIYPQPPYGVIYYDEQTGLDTDEYHEYGFTVYDSSAPLKINLVWTDYPGSAAAGGGLVNDLDLQVTTPSLVTIYPDKAMLPSLAEDLSYFDLTPEASMPDVAVKLTPSTYPVQVISVELGTYNIRSAASGTQIINIYDDDGPGGLPGTLLYSGTVSGLPHFSLVIVTIAGPTISDGSFYVAVLQDSNQDRILQDDTDNGVSYYFDGSTWAADTGYTSYLGATVLTPGDSSPDFDRTNNAVGLTISNPETGLYTLRVSGYNVAHGPQPYALVVSGDITEPPCTDNDNDFYSPDGGDCGPIDCDDNNSSVFPGAAEECNGVDNNCDIIIDGSIDSDGDGVGNMCDNCPDICNLQQLDADNDAAGDVCDPEPGCGGCGEDPCEAPCIIDFDNDGIPDASDNCPDICNSQQMDADGDGVGDVCDDTPGCGGCGQAPCEVEC